MLVVHDLREALTNYQWIVGEPIEERTFTFSRIEREPEPDTIFTFYRVRVEKRLGKSSYEGPGAPLVKAALSEMPPQNNEIIVVKSGGTAVVDGVTLRKRGSLCFSELMPRRYLLALQTDPSGTVGSLALGCRSIYLIDGDILCPREKSPDPVVDGIRGQFRNSLSAFVTGFQ